MPYSTKKNKFELAIIILGKRYFKLRDIIRDKESEYLKAENNSPGSQSSTKFIYKLYYNQIYFNK